MIGMEPCGGPGRAWQAGNAAVFGKAHGFGAHLINVGRADRMVAPPIPGMGGHDIVDASLFETDQEFRVDLPEPGPPAVLPDPEALFWQRQIVRQHVPHKLLHGPDLTPVQVSSGTSFTSQVRLPPLKC
jgi:hypothetical protein